MLRIKFGECLASAWRISRKSEESPNDDEMCGQLQQSREQQRSDNVH